jgi:hypothetical protein
MAPQRIEIKPSAGLAISLCLAHLGAGAAIWCAALPLPVRGGLMVAIAAALGWSLFARAMLRSAESIVALEITTTGRLSFLTRRGKWHACELLGTSYVSPRLTILNLKPDDRRLVRHVVVVPDNAEAGDFRRLRTWLRWTCRDEASGEERTVSG